MQEAYPTIKKMAERLRSQAHLVSPETPVLTQERAPPWVQTGLEFQKKTPEMPRSSKFPGNFPSTHEISASLMSSFCLLFWQ